MTESGADESVGVVHRWHMLAGLMMIGWAAKWGFGTVVAMGHRMSASAGAATGPMGLGAMRETIGVVST
ncbi:MAG: hypothetical protein J7M38_14715, partial [Armatimonadetes bacterium]|nr:hypothetical protein [Armatimonadota bacterium]